MGRYVGAVEMSGCGDGMDLEYSEAWTVFPRSCPGAVPFLILFRLASPTTGKLPIPIGA